MKYWTEQKKKKRTTKIDLIILFFFRSFRINFVYHFLGDTLGDGHGGDTTRLRAANEAALGVAVLVQVLRELSGLARARLADHNDHAVLAYDLEQLLFDGKDGQELALLFERVVLGELGHRFALVGHVVGELLALLVVNGLLATAAIGTRDLFVALVLHAEQVAELGAGQVVDLGGGERALLLLAIATHRLAALAAHDRHVGRRVLERHDGLELLGEGDAAVEKGRKHVAHNDVDARLRLLVEVVVVRRLRHDATLHHAICLPLFHVLFTMSVANEMSLLK